MRRLPFKLILFLVAWYEVAAELGLGGGTALAVTLLVFGGALMLLQVPGQVLSLLGPRVIVLVGPVLVWMGLACWLMPGPVTAFPLLWVGVAALLAGAGAAGRYAATRHPVPLTPHLPMLRAGTVPASCVLLGFSQFTPGGVVGVAVMLALIAMPLRTGWRFIGPVPPKRFDARMGDGASAGQAGFREE